MEVRGVDEYNLVTMYAGLIQAHDMLSRLKAMDPEEREKHLRLDKDYSYDKVSEEYATANGRIAALEIQLLDHGDPYLEVFWTAC
jgi:hypothetical protein